MTGGREGVSISTRILLDVIRTAVVFCKKGKKWRSGDRKIFCSQLRKREGLDIRSASGADHYACPLLTAR